MNKFFGTLILQNILLIYLVVSLPIYLYLKTLTNIADYDFLILIIYIIAVVVISILNNYLLNDATLSFGFLRFFPFVILLIKLNSLLKIEYPNISLTYYQKYILVIHLMNPHAVLTEEEYQYFSKLIKPTDDPEYEFSLFIETPFWYELQEGLDHYGVRRDLFSEKGIKYSEKSFAIRFFTFITLYLILIAILYLHMFGL